MAQANFAYAAPTNDTEGASAGLSLFADRAALRATLRDDAEAAGFRIVEAADIARLLEGDERPLGEVVLVDCPLVDGRVLAALSRLDEHVAHARAQLVVATTLAALEDVFGCLDQCAPQFLVDPSRADRLLALGAARARLPNPRLRELSDEDRLMLLRLTEQVGKIAERVERISGGASVPESDGAFRFEAPHREFSGINGDPGDRLVRTSRPSLPDPRLIRRIIRQRQLRARFFDGDLFGDPAWDMLLDLTAARVEHGRVSVTSLCIASGVPPTTALRWIGQMIDAGLFERVEDDSDRRRAFIALTDRAAEAMARYFAELGGNAARLI